MHAMWVERLGWTLIHFLWQGVLIAVVYAGARRCVTCPEQRYLLACAALAAMTAAPLVTFGVMRPDAPLSTGPAPVATHVAGGVPSATSTVVNILPVAVGVWHEQFLPWIVVAWLAGAIAFWMRLMGGWLVAARMRSMLVRPAPPEWQRTLDNLKSRIGLSVPVRLLVSALVQVPSVVGWLRPVVLVPIGALAGLPPEHVQALLLHELAHIRRRDYLVNMLQGVTESLLFYHPAVWWVSGHIRTERELCCDDVAVSAGGGVLTYARALAELESFRPVHFNTAMAANGGSLTHRIGRLLGQSPAVSRTFSGPGVAASAALLAVTACAVFGQSAPATPKFEVASIRPTLHGRTPDGVSHSSIDIPSPGTLRATNASLEECVRWAYEVKEYQIAGPNWLNADSESFDIAAKAAPGTSAKQMRVMLEALLAERFKLAMHREAKILPIYNLVVSKNGPNLHRAAPGGHRSAGSVGGNDGVKITATSVSMADFAYRLSRDLDRPVFDKTGIAGAFDITLEFGRNDATDRPSVFTALQEQLGLRLEATKGPVETIVIDHVEKAPTEN